MYLKKKINFWCNHGKRILKIHQLPSILHLVGVAKWVFVLSWEGDGVPVGVGFGSQGSILQLSFPLCLVWRLRIYLRCHRHLVRNGLLNFSPSHGEDGITYDFTPDTPHSLS